MRRVEELISVCYKRKSRKSSCGRMPPRSLKFEPHIFSYFRAGDGAT